MRPVDPLVGVIDDSQWQWPDDLTDAGLKRLGQVTCALLKQPERWIHRRVERIYFKDHKTARHQVSVDFTLPDDLTPVGSFKGRHVYAAPLFLFTKDHPQPLQDGDGREIPTASYSNIDFVDQTGKRLPLLTRRQSGRIAASVLIECANRAVSGKISENLTSEIGRIAISASASAVPVLKELMDQPDAVCQELHKESTFTELAYMLASHTLVVCLFTEGLPGRSILKLSYDEQTSPGFSVGWRRRQRQRPSYYKQPSSSFSKWHQQARRRLGWKSEMYLMGLTEIGASASYHVEIEIPKELELNEVGLNGMPYDIGWKGLSYADSDPRSWYIQQVGGATDGNIYIPEPVGRQVGVAWVKLRVRRPGFLVGALVASVITTSVLSLAAAGAKAISRVDKSDAAVAALLLVPTLLAAYLARPGEHAITARMLRWARLALMIDGVLPFLAAFFLLTISNAHRLEGAWIWLAAGSTIFILFFVMSNVFPMPHGKSRYYVGR